MLGHDVPFAGVPFFWTRQFNAGLLYVGRVGAWDEIIFSGDVASRVFLAFYVKNNRVLAVAGMNRDREMAAIEQLMHINHMPTPEQVRTNKLNLIEMLHSPVV